jgi:N-acetylneuraminate synthase
MNVDTVTIDGRVIGDGGVFVIAELSANHGGSLAKAKETIHAAADAGVDAIKLQTYRPASITIDSDQPAFRVGDGNLWSGRTLFDLYREAMTPWEWHPELFAEARDRGLSVFSSPFDFDAVDFLEELDAPAFKIASFEILDHALIARAAATDKPLIISTGMATAEEIDEAVGVARSHGTGGLVLLHCNSTYPAEPAQMDLATIADMRARWSCPVGLSDHTLSHSSSIAAVALGAVVLEKHITLRRSDGGPDGAFSLEPHEFAALVESVRETEQAIGSVRYGPSQSEVGSLAFRRSLFVVADVKEGDTFSDENVRSIRPSGGLHPKFVDQVRGRRAVVDVACGTPLDWAMVEGGADDQSG